MRDRKKTLVSVFDLKFWYFTSVHSTLMPPLCSSLWVPFDCAKSMSERRMGRSRMGLEIASRFFSRLNLLPLFFCIFVHSAQKRCEIWLLKRLSSRQVIWNNCLSIGQPRLCPSTQATRSQRLPAVGSYIIFSSRKLNKFTFSYYPRDLNVLSSCKHVYACFPDLKTYQNWNHFAQNIEKWKFKLGEVVVKIRIRPEPIANILFSYKNLNPLCNSTTMLPNFCTVPKILPVNIFITEL